VSIEGFLDLHPVFRLDEYAGELRKAHDLDAVRNHLKYYVRIRRVKRVGPGVYAVVPHGQDLELFWPDPVLVAECIQPDGVFSHHTALELLGAGHSLWYVCTLFCHHPPTPVALGEQCIQFLAHPLAMLKKEQALLGVRKGERKGRTVKFTGPERTLVEGFRQPHWVGGPEEFISSASGFGSLDLALLKKILLTYDQSNLWASVGWFLEQYQKQFYVPDLYLNELAEKRPSRPRYLVRSYRGGTLNKRWNLIIPNHLLNWEGQRAGTEL
jgi:predicted transcriptional regulator of viral defense system